MSETVTVTMSRSAAQGWLNEIHDAIKHVEILHGRNPNYPTVAGYFEEFGHIPEVEQALRTALKSPRVTLDDVREASHDLAGALSPLDLSRPGMDLVVDRALALHRLIEQLREQDETK
jgi:hypothetical protein